ncbi:MAG: DUF1294 domain-containing protein [Eubacteriales bacterium]
MEILKAFSETVIHYRYIFIGYYILMCMITFIFYAADKTKAKKGKWRISEATLITLSFIGGSAGALTAMCILHHKTRNIKFTICVPLSLILHITFTAAIIYFGLFV